MNLLQNSVITLLLFLICTSASAQDKLWAYYKVGSTKSINELKLDVKEKLKENELTYLGGYHPGGKSNLYVMTFTDKSIYSIALYGKTHKAIAAVMKIGMYQSGGKTLLCLLNPEYIFYAYFRNTTNSYEKLKKISDKVHSMFKNLGVSYQGFGGQQSKTDLKTYRYMIGMPYFTEPVELKEFDSFENAVETVEANLKKGKGNTAKVYRLKFSSSNIAIYGVALKSKSTGEAHFLPIIGETHVAAMPYEIIVVDKKVLMLHGKYRLALHWPDLTMGQFMKISSTPGDIEDTMRGLTE
jgi:hypothetical protein